MAERQVREVAARANEAERLEKEEQWADALTGWQGLAADTGEIRFILRAALAAENAGMATDAERLYREAIALGPRRAEGYFGLGSMLRDQRRLAEARSALEQGVALDEQPFALTMLGGICRQLDDLPCAQTALRKSLDIEPNDAETHFHLALALRDDAPDEAVQHFRRAADLAPDLAGVHKALGELLWRLKRNEEAEIVLRRALEEDPNDAWSYHFLGYILERRDDWVGAKAAFLTATTLRSDIGLFWRFLADACAHLGEREQAEGYYRKALSLGVDDPMANARYGLFLMRYGHLGKARTYLQRALDLNPRLTRAQEALDELNARK